MQHEYRNDGFLEGRYTDHYKLNLIMLYNIVIIDDFMT